MLQLSNERAARVCRRASPFATTLDSARVLTSANASLLPPPICLSLLALSPLLSSLPTYITVQRMPLADGDISGVRNKIVRGQLLKKLKREKSQAKLKKRIARKEAEQRGEVVEKGTCISLPLSL